MLGDASEWVRNVRAAGGEASIKRGNGRPVRLTEIPPEGRAPILKLYCEVATSGRHHFQSQIPPRSRISRPSRRTIPCFVSTRHDGVRLARANSQEGLTLSRTRWET